MQKSGQEDILEFQKGGDWSFYSVENTHTSGNEGSQSFRPAVDICFVACDRKKMRAVAIFITLREEIRGVCR